MFSTTPLTVQYRGRNLLRKSTCTDPSNEDLSCIANVREVGRQAGVEWRITEKERMALSFHGIIKFMKQSMTTMFS